MDDSAQKQCVLEVAMEEFYDDVEVQSIMHEIDDENDPPEELSKIVQVTVAMEEDEILESDMFYDSDGQNVKTRKRSKRKNLKSVLATPKPSANPPLAKFRNKENILEMLLQSTSKTEKVIDGLVGDRTFLLQNSHRRRGKRAFRIDDYSRWNNSSVKRRYFTHFEDGYRPVKLIQGEYYSFETHPETDADGKLLIQPEDHNVITVTMHYASLPPTCLKRRISLLEKYPAELTPVQEDLIIAEYAGSMEIQPEKTPKSEPIEGNQNEDDDFLDDSLDDSGATPGVEKFYSDGEKSWIDNNGNFLERNELIDRLLHSRASFEEIPLGKKENACYIVNNIENHEREIDGKVRSYVDDCGVWKHVSVKKCWFVKVKGRYENVKFVNGEYQIMNSQIRATMRAPKERDILAMRNVYGRLKRDENYRRRISWIDTFPRGVTPFQRHIAIFEYVGNYPGANTIPHGNTKKSDASPYVRTPGRYMRTMKERLAFKTVKQVIDEDPTISMTPREVKKLQNLRYRSALRIGPHSAKSKDHTSMMQELLSLVQTNPFVQQATYIKRKAPLVIGYTKEHTSAWRYICSEKSGLQNVMGIDCTLSVGPVHLTVMTYPHPNLQCRADNSSAIMMGPVMAHVDKSWYAYTAFFSHIKEQLEFHGSRSFDGITLALGPKEDVPLLDALKSCFPSSKLGHCIEHMEMDLRKFLASDIGMTDGAVNQITKEIFEGLMSCCHEYDFDMKLINMQSSYEIVSPKLGKFFEKLGEDIKTNYWLPSLDGMPLIKWSDSSCPALESLKSNLSSESASLVNIILKVQHVADEQLNNELQAIFDKGPYELAPHAKRFLHAEEDWLKKSAKERSKAIDNFRRIRTGMSKMSTADSSKDETLD